MSPRLSFSLSLLASLTWPALAAAVSDEYSQRPVVLEPLVVTTAHARQPLVVDLDAKAPAQPVPAHDGADALKAVPGFSVIRKGGADGDPVLRGMAGSRLGILIDGESILGGCGNRMDPPTAYVFPAAYDRITIIKGPQTVLHGPGNSAGLVRFERDHARLDRTQASVFASGTVGDFGRRDAALDLRGGTPVVQARIALTQSRSDDYRDGDGRTVHSHYDRWSANASLAWTPDDRTWIEFSTARSDGEAAYADRGMDGAKFARENYALRVRRERLGERLIAAEAHVYFNYVDHVMDNFSLRPFTPTPTNGGSVSNPDRLTFGGRVLVEMTPREGAALDAGADFQFNRHTVRSTSNQHTSPFEARPRVRDAEFRQAGLFAEWRQNLSTDRRLFAGARADHWEAHDHRAAISLGMSGSLPNPTAGQQRSSVLPSGFVRLEEDRAGATWFAGLGHVQRFPDYWEMFRNESLSSASALALAAERTTQLDAGVLHRRGVLEWSLSAFAAHIDDYLLVQNGVSKPTAMGTRTAIVSRNIRARTLGGEAGLAWRPAERWKFDASLACVRGENASDDLPLAQLPPLEARLSATYAARTWSASALWRGAAAQNRVAVRQGNIVGQDIGASPGFGLVSLNASWTPRPQWRLSAGADNLFDRTYAEHISRAGAAVSGYPQTLRVNEPGRFLWVKLDVRY